MRKKDHGLHNESLNNKLISEVTPVHYKDWIVTTAFYASIHFLDHKIFPCTYAGVNVNCIEDVHSILKQNSQKVSKHQARGILVNAQLFSSSIQYNFLMKQCHNARYIDYRVSPSLAAQAKNCLVKIKSDCGI